MATAGCFTRFGAEYGSHLLKKPEKIDQKGMNYTLFKACRQPYKVYPQIGSTVSSEFRCQISTKRPIVITYKIQ